MSEIELFTFRDHEVRTLILDGEPWFLAVDVCAICALKDTTSALRRVDDRDVRRLRRSDTPQYFRGIAPQVQEVTVVNESGLYDLVFQSPKPEAREFKRWVTSDLLPRYRRGEVAAVAAASVAVPDISTPEGVLAVVEILGNTARELVAAKAQVKALAPAAESWNTLATAAGDLSVADAAKLLSRDPNIKIGERRLFTVLSDLGWIFRGRADQRWRAYQTAIESGRLMELPQSHYHPRTAELIFDPPQIRVTVKGLEWLHNHLRVEDVAS